MAEQTAQQQTAPQRPASKGDQDIVQQKSPDAPSGGDPGAPIDGGPGIWPFDGWLQVDLDWLLDFSNPISVVIGLSVVIIGLSAVITVIAYVTLMVIRAIRPLQSKSSGESNDGTSDKAPAKDEPADESASIADRLISDRPLAPGDPDPLGYGRLAAGLSGFLRNEKTEPPLTVAVTGPWGSGKSSIMSLLHGDLKVHGYRPVWFNAWHHQSEENLLAALLEALRAHGFPLWWTVSGLGFRLRLFWQRCRRAPWPLAAAMATIVILGLAQWALIELDWGEWPGWADDETRAVAGKAPGALAVLMFLRGVYVRLRNTLLDPAQTFAGLAAGFRVQRFRNKLSFRYRFATEFRDVTEALDPLRPVILIDDLDRCRPENVMQVLEAVNFLVSSGDCYVVMGLQMDRVRACVAQGFADLAPDVLVEHPDETASEERAGTEPEQGGDELRRRRFALAQEYLEKLINLEIPVPEFGKENARHLIDAATARPEPATPLAEKRGSFMPVTILASGLALIAVVYGLTFIGQVQPTADGGGTAPVRAVNGEPLRDVPWDWIVGGLGVAVAIFAALAAYAAATYGSRLREAATVTDDSPTFSKALKHWHPLIVRRCRTPRAIKRFLNRLRYLAMCSREGLMALSGDGARAYRMLDEPSLVALAAIDLTLPESLPVTDGEAMAPADLADRVDDSEAQGVLAAHESKFPDSKLDGPALAAYRAITTGLRVH